MAPSSSPQPAKNRKRSAQDLPVTFLPQKNRPARFAYVFALVGIIPVVGLIAGPLAIGFGWQAIRVGREEPSGNGLGHGVVSVFLGCLETVANAAGIILIARGLDWV